jgi:hypothetical protein
MMAGFRRWHEGHQVLMRLWALQQRMQNPAAFDRFVFRLWFMVWFFIPARVFARFWLALARFCAWRALANFPGGWWAIAALRFKARAYRIAYETALESLQFAAPINPKENLMKAIEAGVVEKFVAKEDRGLPPAEQTRFLLEFLDPYTDAKLSDEVYSISGMGNNRKERVRSGTQQNETLKKCLKGWENFKDSNGREIAFDSDMMVNIARIKPKVRREIVDFVRGESEADEGE